MTDPNPPTRIQINPHKPSRKKEQDPMLTYEEALGRHHIAIPKHLQAQAEVPVVSGMWRQGDVYIRPYTPARPLDAGVPAVGIKVVVGEADRNSHILDCPAGTWHPGTYENRVADYGVVHVPDGTVAYLTHTAEHGSVGMTAGDWLIWGQLSYETELRRAAD